MFGIGKTRTPFGNFIDSKRIMQKEVEEETRLSNPIIKKACNEDSYLPSPGTQKRLLEFVRRRGWKSAKAHDLWPL
ncbi:transcriptional regulator [Brevibacillus sp. NPDC003359]|uniref:transcriptional regulator n=1 Tax=unclassified Brevibacillus TaxID=2684853 RepID=UPI0036AACA94